METLEITITQPYAAYGNDESGHTTLYVNVWKETGEIVYIGTSNWSIGSEPWNKSYETPLKVEFKHPLVMFGTPQEILSELVADVRSHLKDGYAEENESGVLFWVGIGR